ncbi:MAG: protein kinase domain-containing protein, partial [Thermoanaerobaculia bacterium]
MIAPGTRVGRFEIESFLGAGGMGEVYVAHDTTLGRRVALKVLPRDCPAARIARFQREAQASSALNHPAIVSVHDAGYSDGVHFLAMELIEGEPLSSWMESRRNVTKIIELMAQVADGLARAHAAGIVHRDLKPANIMIGRGGGYAKVVDFGLAMLTDPVTSPDSPTEMKTASGSVIGTTSYMSPEQTEGKEVDARSDIFSFGTILYELLTGNHPFAGTSRVDTMHNIVNRELPADAVPAAFRRIVRRCLAKDPDERYQSMKDVAHDLRDATREIAPAPPARRRAWIAPAIVALILILAGVAWYANNSKTTTSQPPPQPAVTMARITNSGNINSAAISPDGRFVVYAMTDGDNQALWVKQLSTGTATRISEPAPIFIQRTL